MTGPRIAVAHEWISARAGSEKVFEALAQTFPAADLYALSWDRDVPMDLGGRPVTTTFLDRVPALRDRRGVTLPLMPLAWRYTGHGREYDVVISSSHACVKGLRAGRDAVHLCYVHAPMRYAWSPEIDGRGARPLLAPARAVMRRWDAGSTRWVDSFAANSADVAGRVEQFYGRECRVIHPPVDTDFFAADPRPGRPARAGLLAVGRFIPYKRFDAAIRVSAAVGVPLTVAGRGPLEQELRALAASLAADVTFVVSPSDEVLRDLYRRCRVLLFPGVEDFGIVPVEAQAAGALVAGPGLGGLRDTVVHGTTGMHAADTAVPAVVDATRAALALAPDEEAVRHHAASFGTSRFAAEIRQWVAEIVPATGEAQPVAR